MTNSVSRFLAVALTFGACCVRGETAKVGYALNASTNRLAKYDAVVGIVGYVSGLEPDTFVIFEPEHLTHQGLHVRMSGGRDRPKAGDVVKVSGRMGLSGFRRVYHADKVEVASSAVLPKPHRAKQADFRRGLLNDRLISLEGRVRNVLPEKDGRSTVLRATLDDHDACVRVPGTLDPRKYLDRRIRATGLAVNRCGRDGDIIESELHVQDKDDVQVREVQEVPNAVLYAALLLGIGALSLIVALTILWRRSVHRRLAASAIAAERRRMAADLHDTIEQYLAGAKLIATGVSGMKDVEPRVKSAMATLGDLLASAKKEVRAVVLDLRSESDLSLPDSFRGVVDGLVRAGVRARMRIVDPDPVPAEAVGDLAMIVREAVTNAVKHGRAKHVVLLHERNLVRISNDGEPFDPKTALGPETGHFGLSGMRERAAKNGFQVEWRRRGRWNETRVTT